MSKGNWIFAAAAIVMIGMMMTFMPAHRVYCSGPVSELFQTCEAVR